MSARVVDRRLRAAFPWGRSAARSDAGDSGPRIAPAGHWAGPRVTGSGVPTRRAFRSMPHPPRGVTVAALLAALIALAAMLRLEQAGDRPGHPSADERAYVRLATDLRVNGSYGDPGTRHPLHWAPGAPLLFAAADAITGRAPGDRI